MPLVFLSGWAIGSMPIKRDQDERNRIRLVASRAGKHSMLPTCHGAEPKPGNLLIRTLALATESLLQRKNSLNTFAGIVSALLVGGNPLEHSRLVNYADSGVYGVRSIRHLLSQ